MDDVTTPASGNRWEPSDHPVEPVEPVEPVAASPEPGSRAPWLTRARTVVAGGAAAVLLAGGLGGFAVGHAIAGGDEERAGFDRPGGPAGFDRDSDDDGPGFDQGSPGGAQLPGSRDSDDEDSQDS